MHMLNTTFKTLKPGRPSPRDMAVLLAATFSALASVASVDIADEDLVAVRFTSGKVIEFETTRLDRAGFATDAAARATLADLARRYA